MNEKPANNRNGDTTSAKDLRRQNKIQQIVCAATEVFLEDGFTATSMDKIVKKASVSKSTLYNYYVSKDEIFIAVMQRQFGSISQRIDTDQNKLEDLGVQLQRFGVEWLRIANSPVTLSLFRITTAESQRFPKLAQQFLDEIYEKTIGAIVKILEREEKNARLHITDRRQASEYLVDLLFGTTYLSIVFGVVPPMKKEAIQERTRRALKYFFGTYSSGN